VVKVAWEGQRADVIEALRALSDDNLRQSWSRGESIAPSLTDAVHWLVDDTWLDTRPASSLIPEVFVDHAEAGAIDRAVKALLVVLDGHGPLAEDREYLEHSNWPNVVEASRAALAVLTD
jgi:hypothetical protein